MPYRRIAVASLTLAALVPRPVPAKVTGHLYAATTARPYAILSFPLNDGIPSAEPDFKYPGHFNAITVDEDGFVYGVHWSNNQIVVFAPRNTTPVRRIDFPVVLQNCYGSYYGPVLIGGLAVNRSEDLFVAYTTYFSGLHSRAPRARVRGAVGFPCLGVVAFGPNANGFANPQAAIPLGGQYLDGVTVDRDGRLYVSNSYFDRVLEFTDAAHHPQASGYLTVGMTYPQTLATDLAENLYELDGGFLTKPGVNVYAAGAGSKTGPTSTLMFESAYNWVEDIAVRGSYLYTTDINYHGGDSVDVYDATANGPTAPLLSLPSKHIWFIATGP